MCPDKKLFSLYFDNELPSPWKEKLEEHLASCAECQKKFAVYTKLSRLFASSGPCGLDEAEKRVWQRVSALISGVQAKTAERRYYRGRPGRFAVRSFPAARSSFWKRAIRVPFPLALAALTVMALLLFVPPPLSKNGAAPVTAELTSADIEQLEFDRFDFDVTPAGSLSGMNHVLNFLGPDDSSNVLIIKLPEKKLYDSAGEPVIIRAVDYAKNRDGGLRKK